MSSTPCTLDAYEMEQDEKHGESGRNPILPANRKAGAVIKHSNKCIKPNQMWTRCYLFQSQKHVWPHFGVQGLSSICKARLHLMFKSNDNSNKREWSNREQESYCTQQSMPWTIVNLLFSLVSGILCAGVSKVHDGSFSERLNCQNYNNPVLYNKRLKCSHYFIHAQTHTAMQNYTPWDQPQVETKDLFFASTVVFGREPM